MPAEMARPVHYHDRYSRFPTRVDRQVLTDELPAAPNRTMEFKDCHERAHLLPCPGASPIHSETGHARRAD
jgi:hypothetical protein